MKNIKLATILVIMVSLNFSCDTKPNDRAIGFTSWSDNGEIYKWHLGTDTAVDLVVDLDKFWSKQNYSEMRKFFADTAKFYFRDGKFINNTTDFINKISTDEQNSTTKWDFVSAYSVDLDPSMGGEHVQASFNVKSGDSLVREIHEQYYIIDNKIVLWKQFSLPVK